MQYSYSYVYPSIQLCGIRVPVRVYGYRTVGRAVSAKKSTGTVSGQARGYGIRECKRLHQVNQGYQGVSGPLLRGLHIRRSPTLAPRGGAYEYTRINSAGALLG